MDLCSPGVLADNSSDKVWKRIEKNIATDIARIETKTTNLLQNQLNFLDLPLQGCYILISAT